MAAQLSDNRFAAWTSLLAEVDADRIDSPIARQSIRQLGALGVLVRAWVRAKRRELRAAREDLDRVLSVAGDSAPALLIAGVLAMLLREPGVAIARLRAAGRRNRGAMEKALEFELHVTRRLTWLRDLREVADRAIAEVPSLAREAHAVLSQLYAEALLFERAFDEAEAAFPTSPSIEQVLEHARLAVQAERSDVATKLVEAVLDQAGERDDVRLAAVEVLITAGAFARAQAELHRAIARNDTNVGAWSRLGELRLWHGDDEAADSFATRALERDPVCAAALRVRGICALRRQRVEDALRCFDSALGAAPADAETRVWRARALFLLDRPAEAECDLDEALRLGRGFYLAAELVRFQQEAARVLRFERGRTDGRTGLPRQLVEPAIAFLRHIRSDAAVILTSEDADAQHSLLTEGLDALGANYSILTTLRRHGHLERVPVSFIREEARAALETIRVLSPREVRTRLEQIIARYPESSLPICYLGELYVWLGDVGAARQWLHRAIEHTRTTRWAYIGLGACELIEGQYEKALDMLALGVERLENTTGPAVYPHRAEALRRLGRFDAARADLERALDATPRRLSAWINLALLEAAVGDAPALGRAFEQVRQRAAGLMADAAEDIGEAAWLDGDAVPSAAVQRRLLERMLVMLRGNRATGLVTYFRTDGSLHVLSPINTELARFDKWDLQTSWSLIKMLAPRPHRGR